ncbi:papilin [Nephila pilipes]|uniref:Papilin n=1 Tax=Nephila pilipes TaxID=299642 RepID=A0A8X6QDY1_NEPPI|nr:papilin [Nephila pilipes]
MKVCVFLTLCVVFLTLSVTTNAQCPNNQHRVSCGTSCPLTCKNYKNPPKICTFDCFIGCACNEGYVKLKDKNGPCVEPSKCPK